MTDEELVRLCQASYAAWNAGDVEALVPLYHSDCEWVVGAAQAGLGVDVFHGHQGLRDFMREVRGSFAEYRNEILEIRRDGDRVLIRGTIAGRSPAFGEISQHQAQLGEFRDGLIFRVTQTDDPPPGWDEARPLT